MKRKPSQLAPERARVLSARDLAQERKDSSWRRVAMIGAVERQLVRFGDKTFGGNIGSLPVTIVVTKNLSKTVGELDRAQPYHAVKWLAYVNVRTEQHGKRLKAALDGQLLGRSQFAKRLRGSWRDIADDPYIIWGELLNEAQRVLSANGEVVEFYDDAEVALMQEDRALRRR